MWGKLLGAMIGGALGMLLAWSPPLAAILGAVGALLGHFVVDREVAAPRSTRPPTKDELLERPAPPKRHEPRRIERPKKQASVEDLALIDALCPLFLEVARADAAPVQLEIRVIREFFEHQLGFQEAAMVALRVALKEGLTTPVQDVEVLTARARTAVKPSLRVEVVRSLYDLGLVDGELQRSEQDLLRRIVGLFNLSDEQLQQITAQYFGKGDRQYELLGLAPSVSDDEIKSAFRKLATEHHPDRAQDNGAKFREVKEAYEALRKLRGF